MNTTNSILDSLNEPETVTWSKPISLYEINVPPFPAEALPKWLSEFILALSEFTQTPIDLAGVLVLAALSTVCAKKCRVKIREGYEEPLNLYLAVVLGPANRKSAVVAAVTKPIQEFEELQAEVEAPKIRELSAKYKVKENELSEAHKSIGKPGSKITMSDISRLSEELEEIVVPPLPRFFADDCTPEKLGSLLAEHNGKMAFLSAEGGIFDTIAGRYSNNVPNLDVYLKGHSGDDVRIDRQNQKGKTVFVKEPALTFGLAIQPDVLQSFANHASFKGRGLVGRFNYSLPKSTIGTRKEIPDPIPAILKDIYKINLNRLLELPWCEDARGRKGSNQITLESSAHDLISFYAANLETKLAETEELGSMQDWAGKNVGTVARIAGLLHLAENLDSKNPWQKPICERTMENAIKLGEYFIPHAKAAYLQMEADINIAGAKYILKFVQKKASLTLSTQELWQGTRGRFKKMEKFKAAMSVLEEHNYVRAIESNECRRGRRAAPYYEVNPILITHNSYNSLNSDLSNESEDPNV